MDIEQRLRDEIAAFTATVAGTAPDVPVPTCPDWRLRDLVGHIGQGPRWGAGVVRSGGPPASVPDPRDAEPGPPHEWADWLRDGTAELVDAVHEVGAGTEVWTVAGPRPARWWLRRMLADLVVHRADAALTAGVPFTIDAALAAETISEGLDLLVHATFPPGRAGTIGLRPLEGTGWLVTRTAAGHTWKPGEAPADTTVAGPVRDLLLVLMRRQPVARVTVTGDRELLDELLAYSV